MEDISDDQFSEVFQLIGNGKVAKEAFVDLIEYMAKNGCSASEAVQKLGIQTLTYKEIENTVLKHINTNINFIKQSPDKAFSRLMNIIMREVRGKADAKIVTQVLKEKLKAMNV